MLSVVVKSQTTNYDGLIRCYLPLSLTTGKAHPVENRGLEPRRSLPKIYSRIGQPKPAVSTAYEPVMGGLDGFYEVFHPLYYREDVFSNYWINSTTRVPLLYLVYSSTWFAMPLSFLGLSNTTGEVVVATDGTSLEYGSSGLYRGCFMGFYHSDSHHVTNPLLQ